MVVLLNTPLILLPMRLIPKDSPLFDVLLRAKQGRFKTMHDGGRSAWLQQSACSLRKSNNTEWEGGRGEARSGTLSIGILNVQRGETAKAAKLSHRSHLTMKCLGFKGRGQTQHTGVNSDLWCVVEDHKNVA